MTNLLLLDMGLPMIFPSLVLMTVALVPVILVETLVIKKHLHTNFTRPLVPVSVANLGSTFIGIPATWFLLTVLEFTSVNVLGALTDRNIWSRTFSVTVGAPWVAPGHNDEQWISDALSANPLRNYLLVGRIQDRSRNAVEQKQ